MRPANLKSKIFLDGGDPNETREATKLLGFLDGQTTNPTLIAKNPEAAARLQNGEKFAEEEIFEFYKKVVTEISGLIPDGSVSIEVYADKNTTSAQMMESARQMYNWIPNAHIKLPVTPAGLAAAEQATKAGIKVNMTLCFSQAQAAAVYAATSGGQNTLVSPFIGRLDDKGQNGMDLIKNIIQMYRSSDHHVQVVAASIRSLDHLIACLAAGVDIVTAPFKVLQEWAGAGFPVPDQNYTFPQNNLTAIPYEEIDLNRDWHSFDISHQLTDAGIERFCSDWNNLIKEKPSSEAPVTTAHTATETESEQPLTT